MTNKHVVSDTNAKYTVIMSDGTEYEASVVAFDPMTDLAIMKIENPQKEFSVLPMIEDEKYINI
jgi:serine protease Do